MPDRPNLLVRMRDHGNGASFAAGSPLGREKRA
jgi:hypothetical protein